MHRSRSMVFVVLSAVLAVLATGCLTGDVKVKVDKGGGGQVDIEIFPSADLQQLIAGANLLPVAQDAVHQVRGASLEKFTSDGRIGYKAHIPFENYQDLGQMLIEGTTVGGAKLRIFSSFSLTELEGDWKLDAVLAPEMLSEALRAAPSTEQLVEAGGISPLNSDLRLAISLPGKITRTNGKQTASGTAVWALKTNNDARLTMNTVPKPLLTDTQKVFLGAGLAVLLGIFLVVWGSQRSWGHGADRRERKRAKKLTFPGTAPNSASWANSGPVAHVAEGTRPTSGPMPPRAIPMLAGQPGAPMGAPPPPAPAPYMPPSGDLPVVGPPVAPTVDPSVPNPFAPHRPGAPVPGTQPPPAIPGEAHYGSTPYYPPVPAAPAAPVGPVGPVPAGPVPAPAPYGEAAPLAEAAPPAQVPEALHVVEEASAHHDQIYRDPGHELVGLERKIGEAGLHDPYPLSPREVAHDLEEGPAPALFGDGPTPALFDAVPESRGSEPDAPAGARSGGTGAASTTPEDVPFWFGEDDEDGAGIDSALHDSGPEPPWVAGPEDRSDGAEAPSSSPFSTGAEGDPSGSAAWHSFDVEDVAAAHREAEGWSPELIHDPVAQPATSRSDEPIVEYPSIDGGGGLDFFDQPASSATDDVVEYPSIDGAGGFEDVAGFDDVAAELTGATATTAAGATTAGATAADGEVPADWYPDPDDPNRFRWWDGADWTDYVSESGS